MKLRKRISFCVGVAGFAAVTTLSMMLTHATEKFLEGENQHKQRLFKFKTSDPNGINFSSEMRFQPDDLAKMKITIESGETTNRIEFRVRSDMTENPSDHKFEGHFTEQIVNAKPHASRRPTVRTREGLPVEVRMNDFRFEVMIEPAN